MRIDKYTQKMQEALQAAQDVASQFNQPEITNEHFLLALLDQTRGVARPLLEKMGATVDQLRDRLRAGTGAPPENPRRCSYDLRICERTPQRSWMRRRRRWRN